MKLDDVQTHIETSFDFITKHLPDQYVDKVVEKLTDLKISGVSKAVIRNVKMKGSKGFNASKHLPVLTAMVQVAQASKKEREDFIKVSEQINNSE